MWSSVIEHADLGVVWNSRSLRAELLVKLAGNPILEACPELIPGTLSFVLGTYFSTLCHPFVLGDLATTSRTYLHCRWLLKGKYQK